MDYIYDLTKNDLKKLNIKPIKNAKRYFAIQNGFTGKISGVYARILKNGISYDVMLLDGKDMIEKQYDIITKKNELRWI